MWWRAKHPQEAQSKNPQEYPHHEVVREIDRARHLVAGLVAPHRPMVMAAAAVAPPWIVIPMRTMTPMKWRRTPRKRNRKICLTVRRDGPTCQELRVEKPWPRC